MGVPLREDVSFQLRYSVYWTDINLVSTLNDCNNVNPNFVNSFPTLNAATAVNLLGIEAAAYPQYPGVVAGGGQSNCYMQAPLLGTPGALLGVSSLPVREEAAAGGYLTSLAGYGLTYNTLDNNKRPRAAANGSANSGRVRLVERRACRIVGQPRGTQRYTAIVRCDEEALTSAIVALASQYGRYGYRRITALLVDAGWRVGFDRVQRIWRREGLKVPRRHRPRGRLWLNDGSCVRLKPRHRNHVWSYDFVETQDA